MSSTAKLDDLIVLNQEILAIAKARVPVADELVAASRQMPTGAAMLARLVGSELDKGRPLDEAVAAQGEYMPGFYPAVVAAGVKSGRLASALEGLSDALSRLAVLRRRIALAVIYPLLICAFAWVLLVFTANRLAPQYEWIDPDNPLLLSWFRADSTGYWVLMFSVPVVLVLAAAVEWIASSRASRSFSSGMLLAEWLPGVRSVCRLSAQANFTGLLQLLVAHRTPLPEALRLAADAVGWNQVVEPAGALATELEQGDPLNAQSTSLRRMPPLVRMALLTGDTLEHASRSLWHAARMYHDRANTALTNLSMYLPTAMTGVLGGGAVLVYATLVLWPYFDSLREIANWHSGG